MRRNGFFGALVLALILCGLSAANAAVTPGTKCSKAGVKQTYKGKIYTCVKLGKNLYWNNGTKVVIPKSPSVASKSWKIDGAEFRNQILDIRSKLILSQEYKDANLALQQCSNFRKLLSTLPSDTPKIYLLRDADSNCPGVGFFNTAADLMQEWSSDRDVRNLPVCGSASFSYELIEFSLEKGGSIKFSVKNTSSEDVILRFFNTNLTNAIRSGTFPVSLQLKQGGEITTVIRSEESYNYKNNPFETSWGSISISESKFGWFPAITEIYYDLANPKYLNSCTSLKGAVEKIKVNSCPSGSIELKIKSLTPGYLQNKYLTRWEYNLEFTNKTPVNVDILIPNDLVGARKLDGSIIPSGIKSDYRYMSGNYYYESSAWSGEGMHTNWLSTLAPGASRSAFATRMLVDLLPKDANGYELTGVSWNSFLNLEGLKAKPLGNYVSCDSIPVKLVK